jgi:ribose-phosphate pyrophosphokinase
MKDTLKVLSGTAHPELAHLICNNLGINLCATEVTTFPDGETFVQIHENIRGRDIFIVQPTCPPTNQNLMEMLIMVDAVKRASAHRITAVLPFYGYARQDRKDRPRVPITAKLVANLLVASGVNRVLTMDLHAGQIQGFFDIPVDHLYAGPVLMKAIKERNIEDLVVVSPDVGGIKMTHAYAKALKAPMAIVAKNRVSAEEVEALKLYQRKMQKAFNTPNMIKCIPMLWQELVKIKSRVEDILRTLDNKTVKTEKINEFKKQLISNKRLKEYFN